MVQGVSSSNQLIRPNKNRHSPNRRFDPLRNEYAGNAAIRNSMAIQNLLNPLDKDEKWADSQLLSSDEESEDTIITPRSSPGTTCSSTSDTTSWFAGSDGTTLTTPTSEDSAIAVVLRTRSAIQDATTEAMSTLAATRDYIRRYFDEPNEAFEADQDSNTHTGPMVDLPQPEPPSSNSTEDPPDRRRSESREFRPPYTAEQVMWIWFFLIDAKMKWDDIVAKYRVEWPREGRNKGGMQCKAYRLLEHYGLPKKRAQAEGPANPLRYGMWPNTGRSYKWMDPYADRLQGYIPGGPYYEST